MLSPGDSHWILGNPQQTKQNKKIFLLVQDAELSLQVAIPLPHLPIDCWSYFNNGASFVIQELELQAFALEQHSVRD